MKQPKWYDSGETEQTSRFRWREVYEDEVLVYYVDDTESGQTARMEDAADLFCGSEPQEGCLTPGSPLFYDALNSFFQDEQIHIEETYFKMSLTQEVIEHEHIM